MTHTPGPWTACHNGLCKCKVVSGADHPIAQIVSGEWGDDYPNIRLVAGQAGMGMVAEAYMDRIIYGEIDEEVAVANARLIAAAPDLLAACEVAEVVLAITSHGSLFQLEQQEEVLSRVRAAIARARGG